ncbi:NAD(P)/FAD-dependent oxidoreductase [Omnitrophica bacterium]|nr:NAD(P)/FAD-dependent oxidoreductase [Candidatus Omnitrophota bacterium]
MRPYDIAVIGGGPAGAMAAIRAGGLCAGGKKGRVVLIERNDAIGKKLLLTGKGRCNITNMAPIDTFIERFGRQGAFYRSAFHAFFNKDLVEFLKSKGLRLKMERQGRVFPVSDKAKSVVETLMKCLSEKNVEVRYNMRLLGIKTKDPLLRMDFVSHESLYAKRVILATGGASYKKTGSAGDGFRIAERLEHTIMPLTPGLVPLVTKERWVKELKDLTLKNVRLIFSFGKKKIVSSIGECSFTPFGVSGPLVLDMSSRIIPILKRDKRIRLFIDLKPALDQAKLEKRLLREFQADPSLHLKNILRHLMPQDLVPVFMRLADVDAHKKANQITQGERHSIARLLKALPLTITGSLPLEEAMITGGGISTKEIDPRSMESRIVPGLYFAGEIIDGCTSSGGYSLQQAFSTGYLAGQKAAAICVR